jgi:predicted enzyme related to lactoylglutathione lyase
MARLSGKFVWFEYVTSDVAKAKAFYGDVIGWKTTPFAMKDRTYEMLMAGEKMVGGYATPEPGQRPHWTSYLSVDDVDAAARKVVAEGGALLVAAFDIPEVGRMAKVADPQGATFWIMTGTGEGGDDADAPSSQGTFHWNELWTRDAAKAMRFYEKAFGFTSKTMPMPEGDYHMLEAGGVPRAGVLTSTKPEVPPMWLPYVAVDDCDATAARAKRQGGAIHLEPTDIPNVGRFAILGDPLGATFAVIKPAG